MVQVDIMIMLSDPTPRPSSPREESNSTEVNDSSPRHCIQSLEREFQQVRQHIKLLVQKRTRLLREIKKRRITGEELSDQGTINRWKDVVTRYLYAHDGEVRDDERVQRFPLFNLLPNEVILHIFSYLGAPHLCRITMRTCALFCAIALDESLWQPLYFDNWGDHRVLAGGVEEHEKINWRGLFRRQSRVESNWWNRGRHSVHTFEGHKGAVRCLQFSGSTLLTGSADKTIKMWDLTDDVITNTHTMHDTKWVRCLRYYAPSSVLVTTGMDSTQAKVWNLTAQEVVHVLDVHRGWITCLQLNMPKLVTGSIDGIIRVWDAVTGDNQPTNIVNSGHDSLRSLWLSGDLVMSAGLERNLLLWDLRVKSTTPISTLEGAQQGNYCVQFDTHTHTVASGSNGMVAVGDMRMMKGPTVLLKGHTDVISCLQFSGHKLVTGSMDQTIRVWDLNTRRCANTLYGHDSWVWDLQFDHDKIVTVSGDKVVKLWAFNHSSNMV